jgi:hypothetical protein
MNYKFRLLDKKTALDWIIFLVVAVFLVCLNFYFLIDVSHKYWFLEAQSLPLPQKIVFNPENKDPAYFIFQNTIGIFANFASFFTFIISLSLFLKFKALLSVEKNISFWHVLPYLFVLSFLHEGIQVRIALALSFALWSIVMFAQKKWLLSFILLMVGGTFHLSVLTFLIIPIAIMLHDRFGHRFLYVTMAFTLLLSLTRIIPDVMHYLGQATNARFMLYSGDFYSLQNKTGLFQYFFIFVGALTTFVWLYYKPSSELWSRLKKIGLTSGCLAVVMLTVFHFNVVVSSRLADLLLLPLLLVLGANLFQLKERRQWFVLWGMTLSLIGYGILRGIVSFKPTLIQEFLKYINSFI